LADGPVRVDEINKQAKQIGITKKPLRTAREKLMVKTTKVAKFKDSYWILSLPEDALKTEEALSKEEGNFGNPGHLQ
jgi:hypothetical protein